MGGYIAPHVDGIRQDDETNIPTTTSFLLYLSSIPVGEGGETEFLTNIQDEEVPSQPAIPTSLAMPTIPGLQAALVRTNTLLMPAAH